MHEKLKVLNQQGYARIKVKNDVIRLDDSNEKPVTKAPPRSGKFT